MAVLMWRDGTARHFVCKGTMFANCGEHQGSSSRRQYPFYLLLLSCVARVLHLTCRAHDPFQHRRSTM